MTHAQSTVHPILALCNAIATQEGAWDPGSIPLLNNNPGDLDFAGQLGASATGAPEYDYVAKFDTPQRGTLALIRQICAQVDEGQTVRQIVNQFAPASAGNDTKTYLANVLQWTGLPADTPVLELIPPLQKLN